MKDHLTRTALLSLLRARDFLGYQLTLANGGMSEAQFDEIAKDYLRGPTVWERNALRAHAAELYELIPERFDADTVSVVFGCSLAAAADAVAAVRETVQKP